jgi:hypothetical protein
MLTVMVHAKVKKEKLEEYLGNKWGQRAIVSNIREYCSLIPIIPLIKQLKK